MGRIRGLVGMEGYVPDVRYTYTVRGIEFEGTHIDFHLHQGLGLKERAEYWTKTYLVGRVVSVYYDPKDAANSVLVPGMQDAQRGLLYWTIGFIVLFGFAFTLVLLSRKRTFEL